jgi:hypothetical protein
MAAEIALQGFRNDCVGRSRVLLSGIGRQRMSLRRGAHRARRAPLREARQHPALDPTGLILELDMAALVRHAGDSLRQHRDDATRLARRPWWRRLFASR